MGRYIECSKVGSERGCWRLCNLKDSGVGVCVSRSSRGSLSGRGWGVCGAKLRLSNQMQRRNGGVNAVATVTQHGLGGGPSVKGTER